MGLASRISPAWYVLLLASILHLLYVLSFWYKIPLHEGIPLGPTDPDPWLRLTLVREWLTGGDWYNHTVSRANTPFAVPVSPWTRPLDLVIALLVKLQPETVDLSLRLMRAALLLPWLWMTLLVAGVFRILARIAAAPATYFMAAFFLAMTPIVWNYFGLANADHHAPMAALFIWAMGGVLNPTPRPRTLAITGVLLGIQLWISMEAAILIALVYSWYGLNWLRGEATRTRQLSILASSVAFTSLLALMLEHPRADWFTPVYDANSIVYVTLMALAALVAWQLTLARAKSLRGRIFLAGSSVAVMLGFFFFLFPLAIRGPLAQVTPFVIDEFLPRITEVRPLYKAEPLMIAAACLQPLLCVWLLLLGWRHPHRRFFAHEHAAPLLFFTVALFALYVGQQRWGYYAFSFLTFTLAPLFAALFEPDHPAFAGRWPATVMRRLSARAQSRYRLPIIAGIVCAPLALMLASGALTNPSAAEAMLKARREYCYAQLRVALRGGQLTSIAEQRDRTLLAPTDLATEILFFTGHRIVASNYHREGEAIQYVWGADSLTDPQRLLQHLAQRHIDAVLICPAIEQPPGSILQGIANGNPPPAGLRPLTGLFPPLPAADADTPPPEHATPQLLLVEPR